MKRVFFIVFMLAMVFVYAQNDVLLEIDGKPIKSTEFKRMYLKNNVNGKISSKDIDNYLQLFVNYKLKVIEAIDNKYDKEKDFKNEYSSYVNQLVKGYMIDSALLNEYLKEAYGRCGKDVRVSFMVFPLESDSAKAYQEAMEAYERVTKDGEDFREVALEMSEAEGKRVDAGYQTVFTMPYNLENFAFSGKVGDVSKPLYANGAFFILKITDIREKAPVEVRASHIYVRLSAKPSVEDSLRAMKTIDSIEQALKSGEDFAEVAKKYSEDIPTAKKGGDLGWFGTGRMFMSIENAVYGINKVGDWTGPVRSPAGYHFLLLTGRKECGSFADEKDNLMKKLKKNERYNIVRHSLYQKMKKQYGFKKIGNLDDLMPMVKKYYNPQWHGDTLFKNDRRVLFEFDGKKYTYADFANYTANHKKTVFYTDEKRLLNVLFNDFLNYLIEQKRADILASKDADFAALIQEYHDGLLLFDITNDEVWNKAADDTAGLRNFFEQNKKKYLEKVNFVVYSYKDKKTYKRLLKILKNKEKKDLSDTIPVIMLNSKDTVLTLEMSGVYGKGDNKYADLVMKKLSKKPNTRIIPIKKEHKVIYVKDNLPYVRGLVMSDYQDFLEKKWLESLHKKHNIKINKDVYEQVKRDLLKSKTKN